ncbi:MAG TPA: hypothetical protein VKF84_10880 [Candidatus Sulfotelmatobacter sp.]|nr:hypothetical protein [Candidatus Sulfotelmatobacter sp.]
MQWLDFSCASKPISISFGTAQQEYRLFQRQSVGGSMIELWPDFAALSSA